MKKLLLTWILFVAILVTGVTARATGNLDNYTISDFKADLVLSRDQERRSVLKTTETITAQFPSYDQNHGLERVFVKEYENHSTSFKLISVTDEKGNNLPYNWSGDALRIGEADKYVHGQKTYVITYSQRDVTKYYPDTDRDEFYWDAIGFEWRVPIQRASVKIVLDNGLASIFTNDAYCYYGSIGADSRCQVSNLSSNQQAQIYTGEISNIGSGQGVTVSFGFEKNTFAGYKASLAEIIQALYTWLLTAQMLIMIPLIFWAVIYWKNVLSRKKEIGTIVPEYLPPKDVSVTVSAQVAGYRKPIITAQLLDLAVRNFIKIYEVKPKTLFRRAQFEIEITKDIGSLKWEEQELLKDIFGTSPAVVGQRLNLKTLRFSQEFYDRTLNNDKDLDNLIETEYGLHQKDQGIKKRMRRVALGLMIVGTMLFIAMFFVMPFLLPQIISIILFIQSFDTYRITDKGLALKRHVEGLKMYIKVAEEERIRMLQSPEGAEKVASVVKGVDSGQLIKLYEQLLPYAVLFGQEKQWNKQIGLYYEANGVQPNWYSSQNTVFSAVAFSSAMNSFSSVGKTASASSSSSGGSSGGGSAGGGGGGGGGGGW